MIQPGLRTKPVSNLLVAGDAGADRLGESAGMEVHNAAGGDGPQQGVQTYHGWQSNSVSDLLTAGNAGSFRSEKPAGIQIHDAAGRAEPEERVAPCRPATCAYLRRIYSVCRWEQASGCGTISRSNLLTAGNAETTSAYKSAGSQVGVKIRCRLTGQWQNQQTGRNRRPE